MNVRWRDGVVTAGRLYVYAFAVDVGLTVVDFTIALDLSPVRWPLSLAMLVASLLVYVAAGSLVGFPRRIFWTLPLYSALGATFLDVLVAVIADETTATLVVLPLTGAVAVAAWIACRVAPLDPSVVAFSGRRLAGFAFLNLVAVPIYVVAALLVVALAWFDASTGGYLRIRPDGLYSVERVFRAEDREVRLVGMVHIGEAPFYRELARSFDARGTVVLEEGVYSRGMPANYADSPMRALATAVGLDDQGDLDFYLDESAHAVRRNADLYWDEFDPATIAWMNDAEDFFRGAELTQPEYEALFPEGGFPDGVHDDLFTRRESNLLDHLDSALGTFPVVIIPWGAAHMPTLDAAVRARGFVPDDGEVVRRVFAWSSLG